MLPVKTIAILLFVILLAAADHAYSQAISPCTGSQLSLAEGEGEADMGGKRYGVFEFTNTSTSACTMTGFPSFSALNRAGKVMTNVAVKYSNDYPNGNMEENANKQVITLEPGKKAWFQIYYNDGMALSQRKPFPKVAKVRIKAPKDTKTFTLKSEFTACCGIQVGSISDSERP